MQGQIWDILVWLVGANAPYPQLSPFQVGSRTAIIFLIALVMIRVAKRRFMGDYSAFDVLLGFIVGSVMARAITGAVTFGDMVIVVVVVVGLHWLFATIAYYFPRFERAIENDERKLIEKGRVNNKAMRKSKITKDELMQALHENGGVDSVDKVETAYLERDGTITVIAAEKEPRIIETKVEDGVQTIRIAIGGR